ncbi:MAG: hypothetical protein EBE86_023000 [Hormoscilla sp. GUM202]|nr:hypothetical protein [Hormoscilla sp. GUM202]
MTIETSASPIAVEAESKQPAIRYGQLDGDGIGNIHESINMFQGEIALPIDLLSVGGSGGLEAAISLHYSSSGVRDAARTWNIESPTGICGLGWSLGRELIYLDNHGSVSANNDIYYLAQSNGGRVRLHCISQTATEWIFESESYDFSRIIYRVNDNLWEITGTSGTVRRYGTNEKNRLKGVKWGGSKGNWSDASNRYGQTNFYLGWMLEEIVNRYGQKITFDYEKLEVTIGSDKEYTRAIYLKKIQSQSRHVRFCYAEKINNNEIQEYLAPHTGTGPEAHQDRFQTKYLDAIEVVKEDPEAVVLRVQFLYSVENAIEVRQTKIQLLMALRLSTITTGCCRRSREMRCRSFSTAWSKSKNIEMLMANS